MTKSTQLIGDVIVSNLKQDYIKIENAKQYKLDIQSIDPFDESRYLDHWKTIKKIIVEGYWGQESKGYRFAPPSLMFYNNFAVIQDTDESKITTNIIPLVQDIEWEQSLMYFEARGFSGFYKDEEYTSDLLRLEWNEDRKPKTKREYQLYNQEGELKEYISPRENLRRLHKYPKGQPLYFNEASNTSVLGTRGGGKSYYLALGEFLHRLVTDGGKYYNNGKFYDFPDYQNELSGKKHPKVELMLGSTDTDKSSELFSKIVANMNALATDPRFGCWKTPDDPDYSPCPLFKDMSGSVQPGNKKNPYSHIYEIIKNGRRIKKGTGSLIYHVSYSAQKGKGKGAQAGAGGRCEISAVEEQGLVENLIQILGSNASVVSRNGVQFGTQANIGTSGNIDAIIQTKKVFLNPQDYNILHYSDVWEGMGKEGRIGFFLPYYMVLREYKDEDGNTNYQKAFEHVFKQRAEKAKASDPSVLRNHKMNHPIVPSEMWLSAKGHYLPHDEAVQREKELIKDNLYLQLAKPAKLIKDSSEESGIRYEVDHDAEPFYTFPISDLLTSYDSAPVIYDPPKINHPIDFYFMTHDPYRSENIDKGGSFGATHVFISPKYWDEYMPITGPLVATYIAKPTQGLKHYYNVQEKLLSLYGNPPRGLAYEANQGADCKNYYINKGKEHVLVLRPYLFDTKKVFQSRITEYGYWTTDVIRDLDRLNDFLLQPLKLLNNKLVIETIPCLFTIQQIVQYNLKDNFDAVSSLTMAPIFEGVLNQEIELNALKKREQNALKFLSTNSFINENNKSREYQGYISQRFK